MKNGKKIKGELRKGDIVFNINYLKNKIKWKEYFFGEYLIFTYRGPIFQCEPHGRGIKTVNKEIFWEGTFRHGKEIDGKGTCKWEDESGHQWKYNGIFIQKKIFPLFFSINSLIILLFFYYFKKKVC